MDINTLLFDEEYIMKQMHLAGVEEGEKKGKREGKREGKKEGKREQKREIALNMLRENYDPSSVQRMTGITAKELESLKKML